MELLFITFQFIFALVPISYADHSQLALSQPLTIRWHYKSNNTINLTPAVNSAHIYMPLADGMLLALDVANGQLLWRAETGGELSASPVADERGVYIASEVLRSPGKEPHAAGALRALGREGGITLWMRTLPLPLRGSLIMNQTTLFGGASDGRVYAVRKSNGEILWVVQHQFPFASHPVLSGSRLYLGSTAGVLFALDQATGKTIWRYQTRGAIKGRIAVSDGMVYFGSGDGYVYAVREIDGRLRWRTRTGAAVQTVALTPSGLLAASLDNYVYFLTFNKGGRIWKRQLAGRLAAEPLVAVDGVLFTPLSSDSGVVLDLRDGKLLNNIPIGEDNYTAASPVTVGELLLVTTRRGLVAFSRPTNTSSTKTH